MVKQTNVICFINEYLPDLEKTSLKYKDKINFYIGLEIEYIKEHHDYFVHLKEKLDYMNLAIHFFIMDNKICGVKNNITPVCYRRLLVEASERRELWLLAFGQPDVSTP